MHACATLTCLTGGHTRVVLGRERGEGGHGSVSAASKEAHYFPDDTITSVISKRALAQHGVV